MSENVYLSKPSIDLQDEYISFYEEWVNSGEDMVPWVISKDPANFPGMIEFLLNNEKSEHVAEGWVPSSTYWLVTDSRKVVGAVNIRHALTEKLFNVGGHIGYGIRNSERRKGYATKLLALSLLKAREVGIERALVVCDKWNTGSERTIRNNGGVEDTSYIEENGNVILRFWIDL
ncbi:MAG: GNAT family N-acetyltransferase [Alicyclobacillus sp. RIFOXYA1_FULL_53_8]|nr:MAG: GNAT family N-acetyltransferase [Alicyclobacillus sp. RIFOXYA1_FULL_53_8]